MTQSAAEHRRAGGRRRRRKKTLNPHLLFGLSLLDVLSPHFDPGGQDGPGEFQHVDAQQVAQLLSRRVVWHGGLVVVLLLEEGDVAKLQHGGDDLEHGCRGDEKVIHSSNTQENTSRRFSWTLLLTEFLLRGEAHDTHGVHGLGEVLRVTLTRDGDGPPAEEAILVSGS